MNTQEGLDILIDVALATQDYGTIAIFISHVLEEGRVWQAFVKLTARNKLEDMITFTGRIPRR